VAFIEIFFQFLGFGEEGVGDDDVFFLNDAVLFAKGGAVFLQECLTHFLGQPERQFAGLSEIGEHVAVQGGERNGGAFSLNARIGGNEFFVEREVFGVVVSAHGGF
jgi:hypothetical protein